MADKPDPSDESDESDEFGDIDSFEVSDEGDEDPIEAATPPSLPPTHRRSRIPLIMAVILGSFIVYKLMAWLFTDHKPKVVQSKPEVEKSMPALPNTPPTADQLPSEKPSEKPSQTPPEPASPDKAKNDALEFLNEAQSLSDKAAAATSPTPPATPAAPPAAPISVPPAVTPAAAPLPVAPAPAPTSNPPIPSTPTPASPPTSALPTPVWPPAATPANPDTGAGPAVGTFTPPPQNPNPPAVPPVDPGEETEKRLETMDRALYRLSKRFDQMQDSVGQLGHDMGNINQSLTMLATEMKKFGEPADNQLKNSDLAKTEAFINPSLTVHAIIPGRAWLRDKTGKTLTVTEGDSLEQFGKVLVIDAPNGVVITSSGITLR